MINTPHPGSTGSNVPLPTENRFWSPRKYLAYAQFLIGFAFWPVYQFADAFFFTWPPSSCHASVACITTHDYASSDLSPPPQFHSCTIPMYYKLVHIGVLWFSPAGGSGVLSCSRIQLRQEHSTRGHNRTSTLIAAYISKTSNICSGVPGAFGFCHS